MTTITTTATTTTTAAGTTAARSTARPDISTVRLLSVQEAEEVRDAVYRERPSWIERGAGFHTLGTPSYLDLTPNSQAGDYHDRAARHRPLLWDRFGWLYNRLGAALVDILDAPVRYTERYALPGFHVWFTEAVFTRPRASVHFDLQYRLFDWPGEVDASRVFSFTLPLRVPAAGGGLNTWPVSHATFLSAMRRDLIDSVGDLRRFHPLQYVPYSPGELVVHSGLLLHQIAPSVSVRPGDERLTLQGHGIWSGDSWLLYW
ncbi:hypothetical protein ND748_04905 [Frankia sp. AiPs1]|uniref:hypothetical protein n=1 Tax=Frankia sp. AiPs1 TaxID=573493 RepID=UPI002044616D|nr:hypothetical protein [Frankia sp. AiPs1]MCM3921016.1 hypothetical protein [Frankia sp. AiPs1]